MAMNVVRLDAGAMGISSGTTRCIMIGFEQRVSPLGLGKAFLPVVDRQPQTCREQTVMSTAR
jgi:hypothetical protein